MQNAASIAALILTTDCMIARTSPTPPASINNTPPQTAGQPMDLF
jgi:chaperonin GroEL (HSP60 family)